MVDSEHAGIRLRRMAPGDVAAVAEIERAAFAAGWSPNALEKELTGNKLSRYIVLEQDNEAAARITGFAGMWLIVDEAHVVTVAVAPELRRQGFGRVLVHGLVDLARRSGMQAATLECRMSNEAARALYRRYGFHEVGLRKNYYADNHEDAVIMTTEELESPAYRERFERLAAELEGRLPGVWPYVADE
jgi:ribosomal-protein-alanine N-acetyltransferase